MVFPDGCFKKKTSCECLLKHQGFDHMYKPIGNGMWCWVGERGGQTNNQLMELKPSDTKKVKMKI